MESIRLITEWAVHFRKKKMKLISTILCVLFLAGRALAISPVASIGTWNLYELKDLTGGLNDSFNALDIASNEAADLLNVFFPRNINGSVATRPGYTRINSTAITGTPDCLGTAFFKLTDATRYLVSVWDDDTIRKMDYGGSGPDGTWDDITGALSFSVSTDDQASFTVAENQIVIEDGLNTTAPYLWSGSGNAVALTADADVPNSSLIEYHLRHLFLSGNDDFPSRLYFSALDDITDYTVTDFLNVETNSGDGIIRGIKTGLDSLYIWKDSSIWRLSGTSRDDFVLERAVQGIGTLSGHSIAVVNSPQDNQQIFVFMTQKGDIAAYDGGVRVEIISKKITRSVPQSLNFSRLDEVTAASYEFLYVISVSLAGVSTHSRLYVFDTLHQAWTRFSGMNANALGSFEDENGKELLMFGDYDGRVNQWDITDTTTDSDPSNTAIDSYYETGHIAFEQEGVEKSVRLVRFFVNQEGASKLMDVEVRGDFESSGSTSSISLAGSGSLWDTAVWDVDAYADLSVTVGRFEANETREVFQIRFDNGNRLNEVFRVRKIQVLVEASGRV